MSIQQYTFFGEHQALEALTQSGDRLIELDRNLDIAALVAVADEIWRGGKETKASSGRKSWASEIMLRTIILKRLYNLSDEQMEYQLRDRLSFLRFVRLGLGDAVPDSRTIWLYAEALSKADGARKLFDAFNQQLFAKGLLVKEGVMIDATFVEVPRQHNSRKENAKIKNSEVPKAWKKKPRKLSQKDTDAKWAKKGNETFYGYKNHVKVREKSKLIANYVSTPASTHDGKAVPDLIDEQDRDIGLHADSAYTGKPIAEHLIKMGVRNHIHEKGVVGRPLDEDQKKRNRHKSKTRVRVEHVFAFMEMSLGGIYNRCIGKVRNEYQIGIMNLCYNICRSVQLLRPTTA
jgi:transposase, IS5 family